MDTPSEQRTPAPSPLFLILAIWLVGFLTLNLPERDVPTSVGGLDMLALAKVMIRGTFLLLLGWTIACYLKLGSIRRLIWQYLPLILFVGWAFVSTLWSPLKTVTLGQSIGQLLLLFLSIHVAMSCRDPRYESKILFQLCLMLTAFSLVAVMLNFAFPEWAALSRDKYVGLYHPTNVASAASCGFLLVLACGMVFKFPWAKRLLVFSIAIHVCALWLASNRLSLVLDLMIGGGLILAYGNRVLVAGLSIVGCLMVVALLVLDPGMHSLDSVLDSTGQYVGRGQSSDELASLSGREEMWTAMWNSFLDAPLTGHGYFVCSNTGALEVWYTYSNHEAHNLILQALVSTGLIGLGLFLLWHLRLIWLYVKRGMGDDPRYHSIFIPLAIWFFFWSLLNSSYLGPVRPESIVIAVTVGIFMNRVLAFKPAQPVS